MILAINGIYFKKGYWYLDAFLHGDLLYFRKEGGSATWQELINENWEDADKFSSEECSDLLKKYINVEAKARYYCNYLR